MIRIVTALALLLAFGREAAAQTAAAPPRLKELVTVTADLVRIGDLVDNAGPAANIAIFRAPDLGQTGSVDVSRVAEALRPHDIAALDTGGLAEVVVTRLSRAIAAKEIEERIARAHRRPIRLRRRQEPRRHVRPRGARRCMSKLDRRRRPVGLAHQRRAAHRAL